MLKRNIFILLTLLVCHLYGAAQKHFDPETLKANLYKYIAKQAQLTSQEQIAFFPIYGQMLDKQRGIFMQLKALRHTKLTTDQQAKELIEKADNLAIELKKIEQDYHIQLLRVVSARKLCNVIKAERRFHHVALKKFIKKP